MGVILVSEKEIRGVFRWEFRVRLVSFVAVGSRSRYEEVGENSVFWDW